MVVKNLKESPLLSELTTAERPELDPSSANIVIASDAALPASKRSKSPL